MERVSGEPRIRSLALSIVLSVAWALVPLAGSSAAAPARTAKVVDRAVSFRISNVDRSALACRSDGAAYEVKGHLIGPASSLGPGASGERPSVTLYLHGYSLGESFWHFSAFPRYDYAAAMARAGHASVVIDRLGYGSSGHPDGAQTCLGAQADIAHQVVGDLRSGDYVVAGGMPLRFGKVALAGHSGGALIANLEALSFADVDALVVMSYTPQVTQAAFEQFYANRGVCQAGGEPAFARGPGGYAFFVQSDAEFRAEAFHRADPAVTATASRLRVRDPCGDTGSIVGALVTDLKSLSRVKAPVLVVCGRDDAVTPDFACPYLKRRYVGSGDVSLYLVRDAGHALPLERAAPAFRRRVSRWLRAHGF